MPVHAEQSNQVKNREEHLMHRRLADLKHSLLSQLHRAERKVLGGGRKVSLETSSTQHRGPGSSLATS
jgi:hypothetical protein